MKFRKRPLEFEAMQLTSFNGVAIMRWAFDLGFTEQDIFPTRPGRFLLETKHGPQVAQAGDWIVVGPCGRLYPCKDEIFQKIAEPLEGSTNGSKTGMDPKKT